MVLPFVNNENIIPAVENNGASAGQENIGNIPESISSISNDPLSKQEGGQENIIENQPPLQENAGAGNIVDKSKGKEKITTLSTPDEKTRKPDLEENHFIDEVDKIHENK